jgi:hypothetical protein
MKELRSEDYAPIHSIPAREERVRKARWKSGNFLKGPLSWEWIKSAAKTNGSALFVALAIRHFCDLKKAKTIKVSLEDLRSSVVSRSAASRALRRLEARGLIEIDRGSGRLLGLRVLEVSPPMIKVRETTDIQ